MSERVGEDAPLLSVKAVHGNSSAATSSSTDVHHRQVPSRNYTHASLQGTRAPGNPTPTSTATSTLYHRLAHLSFYQESNPPATTPLASGSFSPWIRKPLAVVNAENHQHPSTHAADTRNGNIETTPPEYPISDSDLDSQSPQENRRQQQQQHLERHLTLFDLVCVGVGSTIGSGIFVLCGLIARDYAGPATFLSWAVAGLAASLSGCCYAELAGKIPSAGSVYAYAYVTMGELPAVIAAACLTLEYVGSASAVARSWGDKVVEWLQEEIGAGPWVEAYLHPGGGTSPMAFLVSAVSTWLLLKGVKESKSATNFFTSVNVCLVAFMAIGGFVLMNKQNVTPIIPPEYGVAGIFRGATSSFFGYIGYDEVCCIAGEAINPRTNMPRAVMLTLAIVTCLYMFAAFALTGMQPYEEISRTSGFPSAFRWNGVTWAAQLTAAGEVFTLPSVVFITLLAQPRLQFALSQDGLLPEWFGQLNQNGNLWNGALFSGMLMTIISALVPFRYLDDLISAGILVAFSMTNWSVISLRHPSPETDPLALERYLGIFNFLSFVCGFVMTHHFSTFLGKICSMGLLFCAACIPFLILQKCPPSSGRSVLERTFETPFVPFVPCLGMFLNWYLISQLDYFGLSLLVMYLSFAVVCYLTYGSKHSVGNNKGWMSEGGGSRIFTVD